MEVVEISKLDALIAETIRKVSDGVSAVRKDGVLAELPAKIDFQAIVIADGGWQALDSVATDESDSTDKVGGGKTTVVKEEGSTVERQTGTSTDADSGSDRKASSGTNTRKSDTFEQLTNNGEKETTEEE